MSYFAAQGFTQKQCTEALKAFNGVKNPCLSILWKTFDRPGGNCAQRFLFENRSKPHTLQIHFDDSTYRRRAEYYFGAITPEYKRDQYNRELQNRDEYVLSEVRNRALEILQFKIDYGFENSEFILTTGLEDDYTGSAFKAVYEEIKKNIGPGFYIGRNPNGTQESNYRTDDLDFIELHSVKPRFKDSSRARCFASTDGYGIEFQNRNRTGSKPGVLSIPEVRRFIRRYANRGCRVFLWWPDPQGRGGPVFLEPSRRDFRIYRSHVRSINKLVRSFDK